MEALLSNDEDFTCERVNLIPRSDLVLVATSDHFQIDSAQSLRFVHGWPWDSRFEQKARIVQSIQVQSSLTPAGAQLAGRTISYFHYLDVFARKNCGGGGLLEKGTYIVFLKEDSPGLFRAARDRYSTVLKLTGDLSQRFALRGSPTEFEVVSLLFDAALREQDPIQKYERLFHNFHLVKTWQVESEVIPLWRQLTRTSDPLDSALVCLAGANTFWWDLRCSLAAPAVLKRAWPDHPAWIVESPDSVHASRRWDKIRQDWLRNPDDWRRRTIDRYGTIIAAELEHKLLIYQ